MPDHFTLPGPLGSIPAYREMHVSELEIGELLKQAGLQIK
jgi:hypothetical protein